MPRCRYCNVPFQTRWDGIIASPFPFLRILLSPNLIISTSISVCICIRTRICIRICSTYQIIIDVTLHRMDVYFEFKEQRTMYQGMTSYVESIKPSQNVTSSVKKNVTCNARYFRTEVSFNKKKVPKRSEHVINN